ncbi:hypothetical protein GCM10010420_30280 [Streptomyces glaucosporus]|uniref:Peptidoglycan binding domain-containing protein n=1 Tax=Streptomyces glaucosporus TaxID=284044 RepID=A0ABP5VH14_9ACTN
MSRETDSPSSGPQARGGTAYPPGTEPYGAPADGAPDEPAERGAARPGEPKTETTLTTRVRINIPGSRPIPPVVVRKPVGEDTASPGERATSGGAETDAGGAPARSANGAAASAGDANGTAASTGDAGASGTGGSASDTQTTSSWFAPRKPPTGGASGGAAASGTRPPASSGAPAGPARQRTDTPPDGSPISALAGPGPQTGGTPPPGPGHTPPHGVPTATPPHGMRTATPPHGVPAAGGPSGPTTGPATGDMPLLPPGFRQPGAAPSQSSPSASPMSSPGSSPASAPAETGPLPTASGAAAVPPRAGGPASGPAGRVSGDTLVGGIPRVPPADGDGRPVPSPESPAAPVPPPAPAKRGRSKLVLVGVAAFGVLGIAYGAGLLLDHADVPNGTTVLGVEIGGTDKRAAVDKLDAVLGDRADKPLVIAVEGEKTRLKPDVAGLALDTEATVRNASGRDYNPVSVIGSLLGGARHAEPVFTVDEEKLTAALKDLSSKVSGGSAQDGMVKFVGGKAVGVPGKPHKAVDVGKGADLVEDAYRDQVATGEGASVALPVSVQQPEVDQKEIDRAIREFGEPAMSGIVTVKAGDRSIPFSPTGSLPRFLSMKPVDGKLVDTYDLKVLEELYGSTFDGVLVTRGNGTKTPVTPQDVAGALREALRETDPAKRVGVIELDPQ